MHVQTLYMPDMLLYINTGVHPLSNVHVHCMYMCDVCVLHVCIPRTLYAKKSPIDSVMQLTVHLYVYHLNTPPGQLIGTERLLRPEATEESCVCVPQLSA